MIFFPLAYIFFEVTRPCDSFNSRVNEVGIFFWSPSKIGPSLSWWSVWGEALGFTVVLLLPCWLLVSFRLVSGRHLELASTESASSTFLLNVFFHLIYSLGAELELRNSALVLLNFPSERWKKRPEGV